MQKVVVALLAVAAVLGFLVLMLILTFRIRGRMQEAGILLAVGKSKQQIIGQFLIEAMILLWIGFLVAIIIFLPLADTLNSLLFDFITQSLWIMRSKTLPFCRFRFCASLCSQL